MAFKLNTELTKFLKCILFLSKCIENLILRSQNYLYKNYHHLVNMIQGSTWPWLCTNSSKRCEYQIQLSHSLIVTIPSSFLVLLQFLPNNPLCPHLYNHTIPFFSHNIFLKVQVEKSFTWVLNLNLSHYKIKEIKLNLDVIRQTN